MNRRLISSTLSQNRIVLTRPISTSRGRCFPRDSVRCFRAGFCHGANGANRADSPVARVLAPPSASRPHNSLVPTQQVVIPISPPGGPERAKAPSGRATETRAFGERLAEMPPIRLQPPAGTSRQSARATAPCHEADKPPAVSSSTSPPASPRSRGSALGRPTSPRRFSRRSVQRLWHLQEIMSPSF